MKIEKLKKMISEIIETSMTEADLTSVKPPTTFEDFRKKMSDALAAAGADDAVVQMAADLELEGGEIFGSLWKTWQFLEQELKNADDYVKEWPDLVNYYIHDCVIDIYDALDDVETGTQIAHKVVELMK